MVLFVSDGFDLNSLNFSNFFFIFKFIEYKLFHFISTTQLSAWPVHEYVGHLPGLPEHRLLCGLLGQLFPRPSSRQAELQLQGQHDQPVPLLMPSALNGSQTRFIMIRTS